MSRSERQVYPVLSLPGSTPILYPHGAYLPVKEKERGENSIFSIQNTEEKIYKNHKVVSETGKKTVYDSCNTDFVLQVEALKQKMKEIPQLAALLDATAYDGASSFIDYFIQSLREPGDGLFPNTSSEVLLQTKAILEHLCLFYLRLSALNAEERKREEALANDVQSQLKAVCVCGPGAFEKLRAIDKKIMGENGASLDIWMHELRETIFDQTVAEMVRVTRPQAGMEVHMVPRLMAKAKAWGIQLNAYVQDDPFANQLRFTSEDERYAYKFFQHKYAENAVENLVNNLKNYLKHFNFTNSDMVTLEEKQAFIDRSKSVFESFGFNANYFFSDNKDENKTSRFVVDDNLLTHIVLHKLVERDILDTKYYVALGNDRYVFFFQGNMHFYDASDPLMSSQSDMSNWNMSDVAEHWTREELSHVESSNNEWAAVSFYRSLVLPDNYTLDELKNLDSSELIRLYPFFQDAHKKEFIKERLKEKLNTLKHEIAELYAIDDSKYDDAEYDAHQKRLSDLERLVNCMLSFFSKQGLAVSKPILESLTEHESLFDILLLYLFKQCQSAVDVDIIFQFLEEHGKSSALINLVNNGKNINDSISKITFLIESRYADQLIEHHVLRRRKFLNALSHADHQSSIFILKSIIENLYFRDITREKKNSFLEKTLAALLSDPNTNLAWLKDKFCDGALGADSGEPFYISFVRKLSDLGDANSAKRKESIYLLLLSVAKENEVSLDQRFFLIKQILSRYHVTHPKAFDDLLSKLGVSFVMFLMQEIPVENTNHVRIINFLNSPAVLEYLMLATKEQIRPLLLHPGFQKIFEGLSQSDRKRFLSQHVRSLFYCKDKSDFINDLLAKGVAFDALVAQITQPEELRFVMRHITSKALTDKQLRNYLRRLAKSQMFQDAPQNFVQILETEFPEQFALASKTPDIYDLLFNQGSDELRAELAKNIDIFSTRHVAKVLERGACQNTDLLARCAVIADSDQQLQFVLKTLLRYYRDINQKFKPFKKPSNLNIIHPLHKILFGEQLKLDVDASVVRQSFTTFWEQNDIGAAKFLVNHLGDDPCTYPFLIKYGSFEQRIHVYNKTESIAQKKYIVDTLWRDGFQFSSYSGIGVPIERLGISQALCDDLLEVRVKTHKSLEAFETEAINQAGLKISPKFVVDLLTEEAGKVPPPDRHQRLAPEKPESFMKSMWCHIGEKYDFNDWLHFANELVRFNFTKSSGREYNQFDCSVRVGPVRTTDLGYFLLYRHFFVKHDGAQSRVEKLDPAQQGELYEKLNALLVEGATPEWFNKRVKTLSVELNYSRNVRTSSQNSGDQAAVPTYVNSSDTEGHGDEAAARTYQNPPDTDDRDNVAWTLRVPTLNRDSKHHPAAPEGSNQVQVPTLNRTSVNTGQEDIPFSLNDFAKINWETITLNIVNTDFFNRSRSVLESYNAKDAETHESALSNILSLFNRALSDQGYANKDWLAKSLVTHPILKYDLQGILVEKIKQTQEGKSWPSQFQVSSVLELQVEANTLRKPRKPQLIRKGKESDAEFKKKKEAHNKTVVMIPFKMPNLSEKHEDKEQVLQLAAVKYFLINQLTAYADKRRKQDGSTSAWCASFFKNEGNKEVTAAKVALIKDIIADVGAAKDLNGCVSALQNGMRKNKDIVAWRAATQGVLGKVLTHCVSEVQKACDQQQLDASFSRRP